MFMITRSLSDIQRMAGGTGLSEKDALIKIDGVTTDSRRGTKGSLFIPLIGENFNGHKFAEKALENGAVATLWSKNESNPPEGKTVIFVDDTLEALQNLAESYLREVDAKVIGVTGSNGKTTTKDMIAAVLSTTFHVHKTKGNFNNHWGLPLTILAMPEETEAIVLEMGMSAKGEIELLSKIAKPDVAIITNIGESHLMDLGSREGIAEAKLEIAVGLKDGGLLVYDGDEPLLSERSYSFGTKTFGESEQNELYPVSIEQKESLTEFTFNQSARSFVIPILGRHNVLNALASIAVGKFFNVSEENLAIGLRNLELTGMRLEMLKAQAGLSVINDAYNASPTSMKAAVRLVGDLTGYKQKILVLGDMLELGEQEAFLHQEVGETLKDSEVDHLFTYGVLGTEIAKGAAGVMERDRIHVFQEKEDLIQKLRETAGPNDVVLVKASRGMKMEEIVEALIEG
jgi:UDP-N-acetylmuramoyl-tripeptide--D-alanyl-D-alanine ligase